MPLNEHGKAFAYLAAVAIPANIPDVVLADIGLPGMSGIGGIRVKGTLSQADHFNANEL